MNNRKAMVEFADLLSSDTEELIDEMDLAPVEKKVELPSFARKDSMEIVEEEDLADIEEILGKDVDNPLLFPWGPQK
jgi:hypothetical protein